MENDGITDDLSRDLLELRLQPNRAMNQLEFQWIFFEEARDEVKVCLMLAEGTYQCLASDEKPR